MEESLWRWYLPYISRIHGDNSNIPWQIFGIIPYTRTASLFPFHFAVFFLHVNEKRKSAQVPGCRVSCLLRNGFS